jgi:acyl-CoA dehydrogenase
MSRPFVELSDELIMLSDGVSSFVKEKILPEEAKLSPATRGLPPEVVSALSAQARKAGYWMFSAPREYGGCGLTRFEAVVIYEAACQHRFSLPTPGDGVFGHEPPLILYDASPEQIEKYVRPAIANGWRTFTAVSEPSGGSDPARAIRTTARRHGDKYVINGSKLWTTNFENAKYGVVYCRTADKSAGRAGISALIVDLDTPGMTRTEVPVLRDHWTNAVTFEEVEVPAENLVGNEGDGFALAQRWFGLNRLKIAATSIGVAAESVRLATEWVQQRSTFGALLSSRQAVQFAIADAIVQIEAARLLTWKAAWEVDRGAPARTLVSAAKVYASETAFKVVDSMMQLFGGMGMTLEMPFSHWLGGLRVARVVEGPSEVHRHVIAREALSRGVA